MKEWNKKYFTRFIIWMGVYMVSLPISLFIIDSGLVESTIIKWTAALLPVFPFLFAMTAVLHNVRAADEFHRRIHLESILVTALIIGGFTFSYGLLESSELVPHLPTVFIAPIMIWVWGIANAVITRRYQL